MAAGCARPPPPPPFTGPPVAVTVDHYMGSPLTGPIAKPLPANRPADAFAVSVTLVALERPAIGPSSSLTASSRLIVVTRSGLPVQASARMVQAGRFVDGDAATKLRNDVVATQSGASFGRSAAMDSYHAALPAGATAHFDIDDPKLAYRHHIQLALHRADATAPLQVAVAMEDLLAPPAPILDTTPQDSEADRPKSGGLGKIFSSVFPPRSKPTSAPSTQPVGPPAPVRELVLFDRPSFAAQDAFAMMLPFRVGQSASRALAIFVDIEPGSADASHTEMFAKCLDDLKIAVVRATTRPYFESLDNPNWPGLSAALDAMAKPGTPRQPMVFLASQTGVGIFEDIALVGDDTLRQALAAKVFTRLGVPSTVHSKDALAWALQAAGYELLSERSAAGSLPSELMAVLTLHAGEAGRHPGSLDDALKTSNRTSDFDLRLIAENYIYLEDSSPASRVRAFDWLTAHGRAPAGYDPLGPPKARRAALERASSSTTAPGVSP